MSRAMTLEAIAHDAAVNHPANMARERAAEQDGQAANLPVELTQPARRFDLHDRVWWLLGSARISGTVIGGYRGCGDPSCNRHTYFVQVDGCEADSPWEICESVLHPELSA